MFDLLLALLDALSALDDHAQSNGPPSWIRRHRKLVRGVLIVVTAPVVVIASVLLIKWLLNLGPTAKKILLGVLVIQLLGILALLDRRRKA